MRVFIGDLDGYLGRALRRRLAGEEDIQIVGTVGDLEAIPSKVVKAVQIGSLDVATLAKSADAIIIDINKPNADTSLVIDGLRSSRFDSDKVVIAVSTVLTWLGTTPAASGVFTEGSHKRRKPTPRYTPTKTLETHVLSLARDGVRVHIVAAGIQYGGGENDLHFLFRDAWMCEVSSLGIPALEGGSGANFLPMIHVADLSSIITKALSEDAGSPYILAVDNSKSTLADVTNAIASNLGNGKTHVLSPTEADALLLKYDTIADLNANLQFDPESSSAGKLGVEWVAQDGFVSSFPTIAAEFVKERNLRPVRIAVMGPPGAGKTHYASLLAARYYLPVVRCGDAVALALGQASPAFTAEVGSVTWPAGLTEKVTEVMKSASPRLSTTLLARVLHAILSSSRKIRNRGYVLDGYPRTYGEARALFAQREGDSDELDTPEPGDAMDGIDEGDVPLDAAVTPSAAILFEGNSEIFQKRILGLPEAQVTGTHNNAEGFARRTGKYRENNRPDAPKNTALFFEEKVKMEVLEVRVDGPDVDDASLIEKIVAPYVDVGGTAFNYHPTEEEVAAAEAKKRVEEAARTETIRAAAQRAFDAEEKERVKREGEEKMRLEEIAKQEAALLEARSAPLRRYLMDNVIPTLTQGLMEVSKVKPKDPVDYLAEFLFKNALKEQE